MNKTKAIGIAVTGSLLAVAVMMAMESMPNARAHLSAAVPFSAPHGAGNIVQAGQLHETLCHGCDLKMEHGLAAPPSVHHGSTYASSGASGDETVEPVVAASGTPALTPPTHSEEKDHTEIAHAGGGMPASYGALALASPSRHSAGTTESSSGGSGPAGAGSTPSAGGPATTPSGAGGGTGKDSTASPGTAPVSTPPAIAPDVAHCTAPPCGGTPGEPRADPLDPLIIPPPGGSDAVPVPDGNSAPGSDQQAATRPNEVPEPSLAALFGIGLLGLALGRGRRA